MVDFTNSRHFMQKTIEHASNTELLNQVIQNVFPEFDKSIENRNTFIKEGKILRWRDGKTFTEAPELITVREITDKEVAVWEAYRAMVQSLSEVGKYFE